MPTSACSSIASWKPMPAELVTAALRARENASCPLLALQGGAAIEAADGNVFTGCNIENASLGLTVCAERVALWKSTE
jgi:cytidine deaminase